MPGRRASDAVFFMWGDTIGRALQLVESTFEVPGKLIGFSIFSAFTSKALIFFDTGNPLLGILFSSSPFLRASNLPAIPRIILSPIPFLVAAWGNPTIPLSSSAYPLCGICDYSHWKTKSTAQHRSPNRFVRRHSLI